jgi:kynureninase
MEEAAFCSDHHVVRSQVELHGLKADEAIVALKAREGESWLRTEDIVAAINREKDSLALVLLPGIQFYTGQLFDMEAITRAAHHVGAYAGFDLAHAVGNVPLRLHEWQVDFAAWCSYKYLNSGPGAIGGLFVHESHHAQLSEDGGGPDAHERENASVERSAGAAAAAVTLHANLKSVASLPKLRGWWGQTPSQRFKMQSVHVEKPGAQSYMLSNPAVLPTVCMQASLELFALADPIKLRSKSMMLTAYLEHLMRTIIGATSSEDHAESVAAGAAAAAPAASSVSAVASKSSSVHVRILTPRNPCARGAQLSLLFSTPVRSIHHALSLWGIVTDVREPDVLRVSPTPLYNTFRDVFLFVDRLKHVLAEINAQHSK